MPSRRIDRREFLQGGLVAASLVATGRLPLLASQTQTGSGIDGPGEAYAVKPIRDYLPTFPPSRMDVSGQSHSLRYDIIHWNWGRQGRGTHANSVVGKLAIACKSSDDRAVYEVTQNTTVGGVDNVIEAEIVCRPDPLHSLRSWRLRSYEVGADGARDGLSELVEKGHSEAGNIQVDGDKYRYERKASRFVVTQWHLPDFLMRSAEQGLRVTFDLLRDAALLKPDQTLAYDGQVEVPVKNGQTLTLESYAQTGEGILPTHYLLDSKRRVQLVTCGFLSWALQG